MKSKKTTYDQLKELGKNSHIFSSILALLEWDQETHMPSSANAFRGEQIAKLAQYTHKLNTSSKITKLLNQLIDLRSGQILDPSLSSQKQAALREWRRDHIKSLKLPSSFVKNLANIASSASYVWREAREENHFKKFAPYLEKIVLLCRKQADFLGFKDHPYDALLDLYEPGATVAKLTPLFEKLKTVLSSLVKELHTQSACNTAFLKGYFAPDKQLYFAHILLKAMGFSKESSSLDQSAHPFCSGIYPQDTRMTTHVHPDSLMPNIFSVLHEGGHGLYNQGLPLKEYGTPLCQQLSLGIDESQSRMWETIIGKSLPFWKYFYPQLQHTFPEELGRISLSDFHKAINIVRPSLIRIDSDEVSYCLHIILRFEIEKGLIENSLKVKEIPEMWNEKMRTYLGISPKTDSEGCLQDIHWSMGSIGYFPTYALGNLYAAQFFHTFTQKHPEWQQELEKGNLSLIRNWLYENIHRHGREFTPEQLIKQVTGEPLSERYFLEYLRGKYT